MLPPGVIATLRHRPSLISYYSRGVV
jgi:hypothetical protein